MPAPDDQRPTDLPRHVGIIMDGNGRWAAARSLPRLEGHRRGAERLIEIVDDCIDLGIGTLTVFAFSAENWKRPPTEVSDLMGLLRLYLRRELAALHKNRVRIRFIGDHTPIAADIRALIAEAEDLTRNNTGLNLVIALNYGSHNEILAATRRIAALQHPRSPGAGGDRGDRV